MIYNYIILYIVNVFILNQTITGGGEANLGNKLMVYDGMTRLDQLRGSIGRCLSQIQITKLLIIMNGCIHVHNI